MSHQDQEQHGANPTLLESQRSMDKSHRQAGVGAVAVGGFGGEQPQPPLPSEEAEALAGASGPDKTEEKRICGLSRRMAIIAGVALLVIIIAAAAGGAAAAAGGGSSSSSGGNVQPTPSPEVAPSPLEAEPTPSPTTFAPTKFVPPECQLSMLPKEFDPGDHFGSSLALSGDTAIVAAPAFDYATGSVHIFERIDGTNWTKSSVVLTPSDPVFGDEFGRSLSIHGDAIAVGARMYHESSEFGDSILIGCVYVFVRQSDGSWLEEARLLSDDPDSSDVFFASAVALHESTLVVGEPRNSRLPAGEQTGTIHIFERVGEADWVQRAKLRPEDGSAGDNFGSSVDIYENVAVVGARRHDANGRDSGAAYVFTKLDDGTWSQDSKLLPGDGAASDSFGRSVAISLDVVVIGASGDDDNGSSSGSAYVFTFVDNNGQWTEGAKLLAEDGKPSDGFGKAVDADGDVIVIGADGADDDQQPDRLANIGAVYVFERIGVSVWAQTSRLQPPGGDKEDEFGSSVATDNGTVAVGSYSGTPGLYGKVHVVEIC